MVLNLFLLALICAYIVDVSGFTPTWKRALSRLLTGSKTGTDSYSLKPFDCSLCATFWVSVIYVSIVAPCLLNYALCCCASFVAPMIADVLHVIREIFARLIYKL